MRKKGWPYRTAMADVPGLGPNCKPGSKFVFLMALKQPHPEDPGRIYLSGDFPLFPTTDSRLIRHHTSASSCTCTYTATPHVHVQAYLHIYMYKLTCTCTHILRAMRSTWKSPLPNMIRVHFRSGLLCIFRLAGLSSTLHILPSRP